MAALMHGAWGRRGFALPEAVTVVGVIAVVVVLVAVAAHESERVGGLSATKANYQQYAGLTAAYGSDNRGLFWTFSWVPGPMGTVSGFGDLNGHLKLTSNDGHAWMRAAANQAIDIIRRRTGNDSFPAQHGWLPHVLYSQLALAEYLENELHSPLTVSRMDHARRLWRRSFDADPTGQAYLELDRRPSMGGLRWIFSSSYQPVPALFSADARRADTGTTLAQGQTHNSWTTGAEPLKGRALAEIAFPSHKVMLYDGLQRYFGSRVAYYAYTEARQPLLMADGSVAVRTTDESNIGFSPNMPQLRHGFTHFRYQPETSWEPATLSGRVSDSVIGHFRWTRGGLQGRDFEAPEIDTSDW